MSSATAASALPEQNNEHMLPSASHILQQMLDACSSVTTSALSCPTLGSAALRQALAAGVEGGVGADEFDNNDTVNSASNQGEGDSPALEKSTAATDGPNGPASGASASTLSANEAAEYADEVEIAKWLDSQIAEYQAALVRHDEEDRLLAVSSEATTTASAAAAVAATSATTVDNAASGGGTGQKRKRRDSGSAMDVTRRQKERELKRLKEDIFDETVRVQQERLLISRMRMSAAAVYTAFPDTAPRSCDAESGVSKGDQDINDLDEKPKAIEMVPNNNEEEIHAAQLRREALRSRDELVGSGLLKIEDVQQLHSRLETTNADCREWQQKNRDLWNQLTSHGADGICNAAPSNGVVGGTDNSDKYTESIRQENVILKRALAEAIASSGIDWFGDQRLSNAFA
eukprot:CAMPEP_0181022170 /NCGR_PEP_ID=MMETSP1070-20121207/1373_1 /TAXON_ID=265543 /ORGANISM="Minutocellus polymorphus, Strain NH13" /LENGTH=402 /DNA_ID=CAMNT_0023099097 /DNA_START=75 /DNA_END=1280 /DNA_ORIENTATION=-